MDKEFIDTCNLDIHDSFAIVYNIVTQMNETLTIDIEFIEGSIKILPNGDTLYWIEGDCHGKGEYVSSKRWEEYTERNNKN